MSLIGILDPGIDSLNLGDQIISQHSKSHLALHVPPGDEIQFLPTHRFWTANERAAAKECDFFIFAGSNVLAHNFPFNFQWLLAPTDFKLLKGKVRLMGVGAWQYGTFSPLAAKLWNFLLANETHSVRDGYSAQQLSSLGHSVLNTSCHTLWSLPDQLGFSSQKSKCIVTVTDYRKHTKRDLAWLTKLKETYDELVLWPQGSGDEAYLKNLGFEPNSLERSVRSFESALISNQYDYFGTRLHAGIHALHFGARSFVVPVDNRAQEIAKDVGLPVVRTQSQWPSPSAQSFKLELPRSEINFFLESLSVNK